MSESELFNPAGIHRHLTFVFFYYKIYFIYQQRRVSGIMKIKKLVFLLVITFALFGGLYAQTEFPAGYFWSLDAGIGMSDILVKGTSFQIILDPKIWLSPSLMLGSKVGVNYSIEKEKTDIFSNILTFEGQAYLRWNFLKLGRNAEKKTNLFFQGGIGLLSAYRGKKNPLDDVTLTRGSLLAEASAGVTVPLTARWHIEPSVRGGYPHIFGFSITSGYKFPLPQRIINKESPPQIEYVEGPPKIEYIESPPKIEYVESPPKIEYIESPPQIEYVEILKILPPEEIIKKITISSVEYILFGPDIGEYNIEIDNDAQSLNELVLNSTAQMLKNNSDLRVRLEGNANPVTNNPKEADELMALGAVRANAVAAQLRKRGVSEEQLVVISYGGTRTVTNEHDIWNRNRRVELMIMLVDTQ